jgi:DNA-binding FadR family transcriptional regulator
VSRQGSGSEVAKDRRRDQAVRAAADLADAALLRVPDLPGRRFASTSALRRDEADLARFEAYIDDMELTVVAGGYHTYQDTDFHQWLTKVSRNPFFESIMMSIRPHILFGMNLSKTLSPPSYRRHALKALAEHKVLLAAVRRGDAAAARDAMRAHLENSRRRVFEGD